MQTALLILSIGASVFLLGAGSWKLFHLYLAIQDRVRTRCEADARRELRADVEHCMQFVRGNDDPNLILQALRNLLDGEGFVRGAQFRAEYMKLKEGK